MAAERRRKSKRAIVRDTMPVVGAAVGEAAEISRSSKQRREKLKSRRRRTRKSSANNSMKIKKNKRKQLKMKMKKRSSTNSQPDPDPLQQEQEQTNRVSENQSSKPSWAANFDESYFVDEYFTYRTCGTYNSVNRGGRRTFRVLSHVAAGAAAQNSKRCQRFANFAIYEYNKSNNANLELVWIESMNKKADLGFMYFLRFVAKDLDTGHTGLYRAGVHVFGFTMMLPYFKEEEEEWLGEGCMKN